MKHILSTQWCFTDIPLSVEPWRLWTNRGIFFITSFMWANPTKPCRAFSTSVSWAHFDVITNCSWLIFKHVMFCFPGRCRDTCRGRQNGKYACGCRSCDHYFKCKGGRLRYGRCANKACWNPFAGKCGGSEYQLDYWLSSGKVWDKSILCCVRYISAGI